MFNAIAREVGNAASAVAEAVLPGKDGAEQGPSEGEDVHRKARDQDEPLTNDQSGTEEAKEVTHEYVYALLQQVQIQTVTAVLPC